MMILTKDEARALKLAKRMGRIYDRAVSQVRTIARDVHMRPDVADKLARRAGQEAVAAEFGRIP